MKLKYLQLSVLLAALLLGWSYAPENVSAQESLGYCDSIVEASIGPDLVVEPGETFPVSWGADYSTYEPAGEIFIKLICIATASSCVPGKPTRITGSNPRKAAPTWWRAE